MDLFGKKVSIVKYTHFQEANEDNAYEIIRKDLLKYENPFKLIEIKYIKVLNDLDDLLLSKFAKELDKISKVLNNPVGTVEVGRRLFKINLRDEYLKSFPLNLYQFLSFGYFSINNQELIKKIVALLEDYNSIKGDENSIQDLIDNAVDYPLDKQNFKEIVRELSGFDYKILKPNKVLLEGGEINFKLNFESVFQYNIFLKPFFKDFYSHLSLEMKIEFWKRYLIRKMIEPRMDFFIYDTSSENEKWYIIMNIVKYLGKERVRSVMKTTPSRRLRTIRKNLKVLIKRQNLSPKVSKEKFFDLLNEYIELNKKSMS